MRPNAGRFNKHLYRIHMPTPDQEVDVELFAGIELPDDFKSPYFVPHSALKKKHK